jgi:adenylate cyclase
VAVLSVLGITLIVARQNTLDLLSDKGRLMVFSLEQRIEALLQPAENQLAYIAERMTAGDGEHPDPDRIGDLLTGALSATPQIATIAYIDKTGKVTAVRRDGSKVYRQSMAGDPTVTGALALAKKDPHPAWRQVIWRPPFDTPMLNYHQPVHGKSGFRGVLVALIPAAQLSKMLARNDRVIATVDSERTNIVAGSFILYGRDHVLAHPKMTRDEPGLSTTAPLPTVSGFKDPILAGIWQDWREGSNALPNGPGISSHVTETDGTRYIFVYREMAGYGAEPWFVGTYIRMRDALDELIRLALAGVVGIVILVIAIATTVYLGRKIARPVQRLAVAADRVRDLNLSAISDLPGSRIRELNDAAAAFNSMVNGLRWFENYVPRTLVRRLLGRGTDATASEERRVTVMFTDIAGFTPLSEDMPAAEVAEYLNRHFAIVTGCIERHGGTVDKFIGDAVMAFWGAPEEQDDHADRACRAALAIRDAIQDDNASLAERGQPAVRMRIGIHTGPVVVGNIGSPERINYTIVGDTVNVGQRLEALGKDMAPDAVCAILISGDTRAALTSDFHPDHLGEREIRGRDEPVSVYRL